MDGISRREALDTTKILEVEIPIQGAQQMETKDAVGRKNYLRRAAPRISIVILALGFSVLGILSLMNKHQVCAASGLTFEDASSIIGGTASFMLGGIFLIAGSLRWDRSFLGN
jgi:hypothetical protein